MSKGGIENDFVFNNNVAGAGKMIRMGKFSDYTQSSSFRNTFCKWVLLVKEEVVARCKHFSTHVPFCLTD
jgi:hypothetical protein